MKIRNKGITPKTALRNDVVNTKKTTDAVVITDKVVLQDNRSLGKRLLSIPKKVADYTKPRYYKGPDGEIYECGDTLSSKPTSAALGGGIQGYIFGGGPVGLLSGALGGYAGTKIGEATKSDMKAVAGGAAIGAATGLVTTAAMGALLGGTLSGATLIPVAVLGGLAGTSGSLSGNKFVSVRDGMYGGVVSGLVAQCLTGNSAMALAGAVGGGVGGRANTTAGKAILGGGAGALTGAISAIPAVAAMGTAGLPIMAISAGAGAISGAGGAIIGPVIRRTMRNLTMDLSQKGIEKIDKAIGDRKLTKTEKTLAGAGMGAVMFAPLGLVFGGGQGALIGAAAGAAVMGGKTIYDLIQKENKEQKKEEVKPQSPDS